MFFVTPAYAIVNIQGQVVKNGTLNSEQLDLSSYPQGIYFLELKSNTKRVLKKLVLE